MRRPHTGKPYRRRLRFSRISVFPILAALAFSGCQKKESPSASTIQQAPVSSIRVIPAADGLRVQTSAAEFVLFPNGYLKASLAGKNSSATLDDPGTEPGQLVTVAHQPVHDFSFDIANARVSDAQGKLGTAGKHVEVHANSPSLALDETLMLDFYDDFPGLALASASFRNAGQKDVLLDTVALQKHDFNATLVDASAAHHQMWTFQGSSLKWGKDEIFAVPAKFAQENPFGAPVETKDDLGRVGGGIPVVAFWTSQVGEAVGHLETLPLVLSIPVETTSDGRVDVSVQFPANITVKPGEVFSTPRTFVAVYSGDFYEPLSTWSKAIEREGLAKPANNDENYAVSWCGWGYEANVTPKQMTDTIPKLKELGIHWATLDDRWFNNYGDWQPRTDTFGGNAIRDMVKEFHQQGIKLQLWWLPLAVEDGKYKYEEHKYVVSDVVKEHPDWLVLDEKGQPARMARNLATLCPALPEVQDYYKKLTERFIRDWDFDGHKLDNIYSVPPCYNPKHHHKSPNDSVYAMGEVYKVIFETTRALKPYSITQSCPCGTPPSLAWLRYMDQAVTADPVGSIQVRRRIKMYKALLGPRAAIYGDHVELTRLLGANTDHELDVGSDFASTFGTGGVLGTKFTWPDYGPKFKTVYLNDQKMDHWKKWIALYNEKMLSKGNFLDLYVYGYDSPEAYAIEKDGNLFYAFYAPAKPRESHSNLKWSGEIELRGLQAKSYRVTDYVNQRELGTVNGPTARLKVNFDDNLLLEASPIP
ncbi:MAG TPA: alpha-galactosidase [Candidatus Angelobacter sp.]|nr:alpha-galactosidase [Candidatus Angelobacter sp.]